MCPFCAICLSYGPALRPVQLVARGPMFLLCRRCDESDAETVRSRPARYSAPAGRNRVYLPFDEARRNVSFQILRVVQRFDWVSSIEIADILGIPSEATHPRERNNFSVALSRLHRGKLLKRRHILEWGEYQITNAGRARIEYLERAAVEDKASIAA